MAYLAYLDQLDCWANLDCRAKMDFPAPEATWAYLDDLVCRVAKAKVDWKDYRENKDEMGCQDNQDFQATLALTEDLACRLLDQREDLDYQAFQDAMDLEDHLAYQGFEEMLA